MSVIIMHPKHNLETKYKNGGGGGRGVRVCRGRVAGLLSFSSAAAAARHNAEFSDHDIMRMYFLWENIHFALSGNY